LRQTAIAPSTKIFGGDSFLIAAALSSSQVIFRASSVRPGSLIFPDGSAQFFVSGRNTAKISVSMTATWLASTHGTMLVYASAKSLRDSKNAHILA